MKRALAYMFGAVTAPRQTFTLIAFDAQGFIVSLLCLMAVALGWALVAFGWALAGIEPWAPLWLTIPASEYYSWQALFAAPVILAAWMLIAGFVQLVSQRSGGGGSFEATAKLLALSIAISRLVLLIPAWVLVILALTGVLDRAWWMEAFRAGSYATALVWLLMMAEAAWMVVLTSVAVRASHKLRLRPSIRVAVPSVILFYVFILVFLR